MRIDPRTRAGSRIVRAGGKLMVVGGVVWLAALAHGAVVYLLAGWPASDTLTVDLGLAGWLLVLGGTAALFAHFAMRHSVVGGAAASCIAIGVLFLPAFFTGALPLLLGAILLGRALPGVAALLLIGGSFVVTLVFTGWGQDAVVSSVGLSVMGLGWVVLGSVMARGGPASPDSGIDRSK
jgi:hypothetical protein